jgi:hypothetical protein
MEVSIRLIIRRLTIVGHERYACAPVIDGRLVFVRSNAIQQPLSNVVRRDRQSAQCDLGQGVVTG